jgi:hypothetical protein
MPFKSSGLPLGETIIFPRVVTNLDWALLESAASKVQQQHDPPECLFSSELVIDEPLRIVLMG